MELDIDKLTRTRRPSTRIEVQALVAEKDEYLDEWTVVCPGCGLPPRDGGYNGFDVVCESCSDENEQVVIHAER